MATIRCLFTPRLNMFDAVCMGLFSSVVLSGAFSLWWLLLPVIACPLSVFAERALKVHTP